MKLFYTFDDIEQFIEVNKGQSTIGRSSSATFTIRHDTISKVHTLLNYQNGVLTIEDMGSSNGTFINGVKVSKSEVKPSDTIKVGKVAFRVEMTPEEIEAYNAVKGVTTDNDITPAAGVDVVTDKPGQKSETYFDLAELKNIESAAIVSPGKNSKSGNSMQLILGNRKNLFLILGSITVILLMGIVIFSLSQPSSNQKGNNSIGSTSPDAERAKQIKFENLLKEGVEQFLEKPELAKAKFKEALSLAPNKTNNATFSLIQLCDIWILGEKNWSKVNRSEFRKNLDDMRLEDEGISGAILYGFINDMTKLEKFEQDNENKYAEINSFLEKFKMEEALLKLTEIDKSSVFFEIANKKIKQAKFNLIEEFKNRIRNARDTENAQEEVKLIVRLIPMLPVSEQKEYLARKEKQQMNLNKEKIWEQANEKLKNNDLDEARQLFEMFEQIDVHYYEAVDKLAFIKEENARKNIHVLYDISGEGKAALKIITDTMSTKFNDLHDKIKKVDFLYHDALRKGENNPDDISAHNMLKEIIALEINPENEYHKRAKKLLANWTDPEQISIRKYALANDKIKLKDYVTARKLCKEILEIKDDFDVSGVITAIDKYVGYELNLYRNAKTNAIKRGILEKLSKIVLPGDKNHDLIHEKLLELDPPK